MAKKATAKKTPAKKKKATPVKKAAAKPKTKKAKTKVTPKPKVKTLEEIVIDDLRAVKASGKEGVNLDEYESDWLLKFWSLVRNRRDLVKETVFPNRVTNSNELRDALDDLCAYAVARACVLDGKNPLTYEQHCRVYYSNLPMWARFKTNSKGTVI